MSLLKTILDLAHDDCQRAERAEADVEQMQADLDALRQQLAAAQEHGHMLYHLLERAVQTYAVRGDDGPYCHFCGATWADECVPPLIDTATIWHHDDCPVVLARAVQEPPPSKKAV